VFRTLDDVPVVAPSTTGWCEEFSRNYKYICKATNVAIAADCPHCEKAFTNQTEGVILGIKFNTKKQEWSLPKEKADELIRKILWAVEASSMSLKQTQQLLGSLNDLSQMCPFIKPFRALVNSFLGSFNSDDQVLLSMCSQARKDLMVCARATETARYGIPIPSQPSQPNLVALTCYSDAAGCKFMMIRGERTCNNLENDRGVASLIIDEKGEIKQWARVTWPKQFLEKSTDKKGAFFGSKTTTLEAIGLLLPFLVTPLTLKGKHVVFKVDNLAVVFGWENKIVKHDTTASIVIRAIHLMAAYLGVWVHVQHVPRCSDKFSVLADHLSRKSSTSESDMQLLGNTRESEVRGALHDWLRNPSENWALPNTLLEELSNKL
jgi:hypothetical protein